MKPDDEGGPPPSKPGAKWLRRAKIGTAALVGVAVFGLAALYGLDRAFPPPLPEKIAVSQEVDDRNGALLRAYAASDGYWRLSASLDQIDPEFIKMLVAYEDKRFWDHSGVDLLALLRAAGQFAENRQIVSGGSTLSMQLARLIEPRDSRSLGAKVRQIFRAWQIERRLTKQEILERYLTLAPYGGNLEGVRAAALAYFGKEPQRLTVPEAALLVALPQSPERRRPDKFPANAKAARDRVLERMVTSGLLGEREAARAAAEEAPTQRLALPALAAHLADDALRAAPGETSHKLTISKPVQIGLERVAKAAAEKLGDRISVAMVLADARTGDILGLVGSADYFDPRRFGWIDMTSANRSPGSTLKPFIYGLAFEQGLIAQETMIADRPVDFGGYRPRNFDMDYQGDVTIRQALQRSLNVPAVKLLDAVGPARLTSRIRDAGVALTVPPGEAPGLAIGLGGAGITLRDLVQLYTGLANGGRAKRLHDGTEKNFEPLDAAMVLEPSATWQVTDILYGARRPEGASPRALAYKTGTSYGYRDAWSVGYDGRYVLGVWVGRADSASVPGLAGYVSAAPVLYEGFVKSGLAVEPRLRPPAGTFRAAASDLPITLQRFDTPLASASMIAGANTITEAAPQIIFPPDGAHVELSTPTTPNPLVLKLQGGRAPFRWLANGKPLEEVARRRTTMWEPDTTGYSTLTVIDAAGRAASIGIYVE